MAFLPWSIPISIVALLAVSSAAAAQAEPEDPRVPPEVAIQDKDYADARRTFATRLVKRGPSPQKAPTLEVNGSAESITFPSAARTLQAWISKPVPGAGPGQPAVLFLHGGFQFGPEDWEMTWPYRAAGFIVMVPMLRGENGQAGDFTMFYDEVNDVLAAGDFLARQQGVDPQQIFLAGHSVGGTMALLAGMTTGRFRAVASFSGSPDQVIYCRLGVPPGIIPFDTTDAREFEVRSPLSYATSLKSPTRLYYGTRELHWDLTTRKLVELARARGLDVSAMQVEGGHESAVPEAMALSIAFFQKALSHAPAPLY